MHEGNIHGLLIKAIDNSNSIYQHSNERISGEFTLNKLLQEQSAWSRFLYFMFYWFPCVV